MKQCPKCNVQYADETLNFCLDDGEWLKSDGDVEPATAFLSEPPAVAGVLTQPTDQLGERATAIFPGGAEAKPQGSSGDLSERQSFSAHQAAKPRGKVGGRKWLVAGAGIAIILIAGFFGYREV